MAKSKTLYSCSACSSQSPQWAGQCSDCGGWNTLSEVVVMAKSASARFAGYSGDTAASVQRLSAVKTDQQVRTSVGMEELDRVLGGGLVTGSVVLIGGDPGIGKSTLLLQVLSTLSAKLDSLYVTGEESPQQISMRVLVENAAGRFRLRVVQCRVKLQHGLFCGLNRVHVLPVLQRCHRATRPT